ncbi:MAG: integrin alpha [Chloroflexota bacterium]
MNTHPVHHQLVKWLFVCLLPGMFLAAASHTQSLSAGTDEADPAGLSETPDWTAESDQPLAYFGASVTTAGDVNGDGYDDVIVGANGYDNGQDGEGRAFVYYGSAAGLSLVADWTAESDQQWADFGVSVASAGDVNGDGYDDVIVGAFEYSNGQMSEGRAFVYYGSAAGLSLVADWTAEGDQDYAWFGISVASAGDVNGDGYDDVIVGADGYDNGQTDEGRAFVYHGSAVGLSLAANWTVESDQAGGRFGLPVATAGDVNGDGYDDLIIGAYAYDNGQGNKGRAFVYHGSASGLGLTANWTAESGQATAHFARSVATAGDVNGDGYSDVLVGAYRYDNGQGDEGRAFVYHGSATGLSLVANWTAESDQQSAYFGWSVATAGDVNGDGIDDVIVGAARYDNSLLDEGRAYVYYGSASGLGLTANWTAESGQAGAELGFAVASAGDVNGDGDDEVILGADRYDNRQSDEGRAYVYHGDSDFPFRFYLPMVINSLPSVRRMEIGGQDHRSANSG